MSEVDSDEVIEITTSLPDQVAAEKLAASLIENRLAACVQISSPVISFYRWKDEVQRDQEFSLKIKTALSVRDQAVAFLRANHPYELPEILFQVVRSTPEYREWVFKETR